MLQKLKKSIVYLSLIATFLIPLSLMQPVYAAGCPGTAAPDGTDCSKIPLGCPGSTLQGPVAKTGTLTCPYSPTGTFTCPKDACIFSDTPVPATPDAAATSGNCATPEKCDLVQKYINPLINALAAGVGIAVTIAIIWAGIEYSSSGGDPQKISIAKNRIRNAIISLVLFFFLWSLLNFLVPGGLF
jgi:hypothetical protein